ncbi:MAG: hydratase [Variovorax sp.]
MTSTAPQDIAQLLHRAHSGGARPVSTGWPLHAPADAYAVQDATLAALGPIGGWKVGASGPDVTPHCAPLPKPWIFDSGAVLSGAKYPARLVELEVALRVGPEALHVTRDMPTPAELAQCFDAVVPTIELVESRLAEGRDALALARLADLQSHGALIVGAPASMTAPAEPLLDLRTVQAVLWFGDQCAARTTGGNPAQDVWRMVGWLARHCTERGVPLLRGQIVTTGSCTGLLAARAGQAVRGEVAGIGTVALRFGT